MSICVKLTAKILAACALFKPGTTICPACTLVLPIWDYMEDSYVLRSHLMSRSLANFLSCIPYSAEPF